MHAEYWKRLTHGIGEFSPFAFQKARPKYVRRRMVLYFARHDTSKTAVASFQVDNHSKLWHFDNSSCRLSVPDYLINSTLSPPLDPPVNGGRKLPFTPLASTEAYATPHSSPLSQARRLTLPLTPHPLSVSFVNLDTATDILIKSQRIGMI